MEAWQTLGGRLTMMLKRLLAKSECLSFTDSFSLLLCYMQGLREGDDTRIW